MGCAIKTHHHQFAEAWLPIFRLFKKIRERSKSPKASYNFFIVYYWRLPICSSVDHFRCRLPPLMALCATLVFILSIGVGSRSVLCVIFGSCSTDCLKSLSTLFMQHSVYPNVELPLILSLTWVQGQANSACLYSVRINALFQCVSSHDAGFMYDEDEDKDGK